MEKIKPDFGNYIRYEAHPGGSDQPADLLDVMLADQLRSGPKTVHEKIAQTVFDNGLVEVDAEDIVFYEEDPKKLDPQFRRVVALHLQERDQRN